VRKSEYKRQIKHFRQYEFLGGNLIASILKIICICPCDFCKSVGNDSKSFETNLQTLDTNNTDHFRKKNEKNNLQTLGGDTNNTSFASIPRLLKSVCGANAGQKTGEELGTQTFFSFLLFLGRTWTQTSFWAPACTSISTI
jgi:hypothetical protein